MMMRYHWGQGIGHTYCRGSSIAGCDSLPQIEQPEDDGTGGLEPEVCEEHGLDEIGGEEFDALEYSMNERENECLTESDEDIGQDDLDDDTLLEMADMYYSQVL
jgi:hypothetical protein